MSSVSRGGGGVTPVVWELARRQEELGSDVSIGSLHDPFTAEDIPTDNAIPLHLGRSTWPKSFGLSRELTRKLSATCRDVDVVHAHGLWQFTTLAARKFARRLERPLVITPHGMLEPWALRNGRWKKRMMSALVETRNLRSAACLHATAPQEAANIRAAGFHNPVAVVPIGLDVSAYYSRPTTGMVTTRWPELKDKRIALFVSRIHPKKGLLNLVAGWAAVHHNFSEWQLVIAGPDDRGHERGVKAEVHAAGIADKVSFVGPVYGTEKTELFAAADLFVLPTFSENFGIVVPEALASETPVITTTGTPWSELQEYDCGWYIDVGLDPLIAALNSALKLSVNELHEMGQRGRRLIANKYSWVTIAEQMLDVYRWTCGDGEKPECVCLS